MLSTQSQPHTDVTTPWAEPRARLALGRISSPCYLLAVSWYVFEFIYFSSLKTTFS